MKIQMVGVQKQFGQQILFHDVIFTFPEKGLVAIVGSSGCGKTTLLKMLAGLDDQYSGSIRLGNFSLKGSSIGQKEDFRLNHLGFVFQDFRLLNMDTVEANILVPYLPFHHLDKAHKKRLVREVLHWVGLDGFEKRIVNSLSGGEKQRVCLARALINDPSVIFADEPTGALDRNHGNAVLSLLKKLSLDRPVLVVTHDEDLAKQYADVLVRVVDHQLEETILKNAEKMMIKSFFPHHLKNRAKRTLPLSWSIGHARGNLKQKKWRTAISQLALGMSLVGVGVSLSISGTISGRIENALNALLGEPSILMTPTEKSQKDVSQIDGAPMNEVLSLAEAYPDKIDGIGISYENNFEDMFKDANTLSFLLNGQKQPLPSFNMRLLNDFEWLEKVKDPIFPFRPPKMENDEVVLGLSYSDLKAMTSSLQIKSTSAALSSYLEQHEIILSFELRNESWVYEDEQLLTLIGFFLTEHPCFVHDNSLWNEWFFEESMRFPSTSDFSMVPELPWTLRKVPFFHLREEATAFFQIAQKDNRFNAFVLERFRPENHRAICGTELVCHAPRLQVYLSEKNGVEINTVDFIRKTAPFLGHYVICSPNGYLMYPDALMAGFAKETFFTSSSSLLNEVIDAVSVVSAQEQNQTFVLPKGILSGSFLKTGEEAVRLHPLPENLLFGRIPKAVDEIIVSEKMARLLYSENSNALGKNLYVGSLLNETKDSTQVIRRSFGVVPLTIVGISRGSSSFIAQNDDWGIAFFRDLLGVSSFNLFPNSIAFALHQEVSDEQLQRLHQQFPAYDFDNPSSTIAKSLEETTNYMSLILFCLSGLGMVVSILLLGLVLYLFLIENRNESELFLTLGFGPSERRRQSMMCGWVLSGQTLLVSWVEMLTLDIGLGVFLDEYFQISSGLNVTPLPYLAMLVVTLFVTAVVGFAITFPKKKIAV